MRAREVTGKEVRDLRENVLRGGGHTCEIHCFTGRNDDPMKGLMLTVEDGRDITQAAFEVGPDGQKLWLTVAVRGDGAFEMILHRDGRPAMYRGGRADGEARVVEIDREADIEAACNSIAAQVGWAFADASKEDA